MAEANKPKPTGLALLREPFPAHQIAKLPKPTKKQTEDLKAAVDKGDFSLGIRCKLCGAWHHKDVTHLDYVGHAALTDRLLDADPAWVWSPAALKDGLPAFDATGGLWINLTVCGVTRLGYGHAAGKPNQDPGAREKEVIGDALRNAAMRFGAALDLWHKGDLHGDGETVEPKEKTGPDEQEQEVITPAQSRDKMLAALASAKTAKQFTDLIERNTFKDALAKLAEDAPPMALQVTAEIGKKRTALLIDDEIPDFDGKAAE